MKPSAPYSPTPLSGSHQRTYETIFQHPIAHNLGWHDVFALLRQLGEVDESPNGNLKVTRNGQTMVLHPPRSKQVSENDEMMSLRHFLERSEPVISAAEAPVSWCLLVIDHHEARVFHSENAEAIPQHITPPAKEEFFRHAQDSLASARGQEKPDPNTFFEPVAGALAAAGQIVVFGTGTGMSSEMDQFIAWLKIRHAEMASRIIGTLVVDEHHLTDGQLLAKGREFYATMSAVPR